jgi:hypothetical protein
LKDSAFKDPDSLLQDPTNFTPIQAIIQATIPSPALQKSKRHPPKITGIPASNNGIYLIYLMFCDLERPLDLVSDSEFIPFHTLAMHTLTAHTKFND